ncbi:hypothetical protein EG329_007976 [Mollisiaceae sp. DMI_Dod_QoI]|nr:hypothetical protein EG329_007976 [Helotiales sp. DMI_Dod_QoI]
MIILAVYYTLADIVLLGQCFYYRGFTWRDEIIPPKSSQQTSNLGEANERTGLLSSSIDRERRGSAISASHLSPAVPLLDAPKPSDPPAIANQKPTTRLQATLFNLFAVLMVCAAGVLGWYVSNRSQGGKRNPKHPSSDDDILSFSLWGQIFGYFCAVLYLGSRIPQLLLNYRRKSTEGVSMLFFLFACIGNLTYVLSIFAYEPNCTGKHGKCHRGEAASLYGRYIAVNASWLAGSLGTLFLDAAIFIQFFLYREEGEAEDSAVESGYVTLNGNGRVGERDHRPLLERGDSRYQ